MNIKDTPKKQREVLWKIHSGFNFPANYGHFAFHAAMIVRGHDKLYIYPRMKMLYSHLGE
jgi:hypothetical protein